MYLHLGVDEMILVDDVIAMIDLDTVSDSEVSQEFLELARVEGRLNRIDKKGKETSFVLTRSGDIYLSPISASTLRKRCGFVDRLAGAEADLSG